MNDTKRNPDPSNSEDAYERGARGSASVNGEDDQAPTEQAPVTEQGDGSGAPDTGSDVAELSTRDDWQRKVDERVKHVVESVVGNLPAVGRDMQSLMSRLDALEKKLDEIESKRK